MIKKLVVLRRFSQALWFGFFVVILWSTTYPLKGPVPPEWIFKIDPLVVFATSLAERVLLSGLIASLLMLVSTFILGRFFCGWVCPLGTLNDWLSASRRKKRELADRTNARIRKLKYFLLGSIFVFALIGVQAAWVLDPLVIAARFVSLNLIPTVTLALNQLFIAGIQTFGLYDGFVYDFYQELKTSFFGINVYYFENSFAIFVFFLAVLIPAIYLSRFWCRILCPLGAIYDLAAKPAILEREVEKCINCGICKSRCRMGAIRDDMSYAKGECILCMDCVYDCPEQVTQFRWGSKKNRQRENRIGPERGNGISRRDFLLMFFSSLVFAGSKARRAWGFGGGGSEPGTLASNVIRPPGALKETDFVDRCIRCGNCMKVCITNGLQPVMFETGLEGIWTPQLVPEIGYCEYQCTLCGHVCPTGAIPKLPLEVKKKVKLGLAQIDRGICLPWAKNEECIVCEEHCPIAEKAIKLTGTGVMKPVIDPVLCVGCGICQSVCPVRPIRAVRVFPINI